MFQYNVIDSARRRQLTVKCTHAKSHRAKIKLHDVCNGSLRGLDARQTGKTECARRETIIQYCKVNKTLVKYQACGSCNAVNPGHKCSSHYLFREGSAVCENDQCDQHVEVGC